MGSYGGAFVITFPRCIVMSSPPTWKANLTCCCATDVETADPPSLWGLQEELFIKFAEFEEKCKEVDRARAIYKYALDHIPKHQADAVYQRFVAFEKQHGDREGIEVRTRVLLCLQALAAATKHVSCSFCTGTEWQFCLHAGCDCERKEIPVRGGCEARSIEL